MKSFWMGCKTNSDRKRINWWPQLCKIGQQCPLSSEIQDPETLKFWPIWPTKPSGGEPRGISEKSQLSQSGSKAPAKSVSSGCHQARVPPADPYLASWEIECVMSGEQKTWFRPPGRLWSVYSQCLTSAAAALVKPSLRVSPRLSLLVCKCVSAIRKMGGMVSWSARSTGRGPPGPALSSFLTYCCRRWRGPEKRYGRPLALSGRFDVLSPRSVGWLGNRGQTDEGVIR